LEPRAPGLAVRRQLAATRPGEQSLFEINRRECRKEVETNAGLLTSFPEMRSGQVSVKPVTAVAPLFRSGQREAGDSGRAARGLFGATARPQNAGAASAVEHAVCIDAGLSLVLDIIDAGLVVIRRRGLMLLLWLGQGFCLGGLLLVVGWWLLSSPFCVPHDRPFPRPPGISARVGNKRQ
jgi:hypothetical protein